ncbi:MAG: DUF2203 domain-containing protein [Bacteroidetes bacterium]|nr:DUF2203 domain-containing protein [Bacteroidota bacterium]
MPYVYPIHFTLEEAQTMLPGVVKRIERIRDLKRQLDAKGYDIRMHRHFNGVGANGLKAFPDQMEELIQAYQNLNNSGVLLKDIDRGLIDFPCIRSNGEEVLLCFMLGEERIGYWHTLADGYPGRKDISTL